MTTKTVSAEFSDFNSAELAARHIKNNFDGVIRIRIGRVKETLPGLTPDIEELHGPEDFARANISGVTMSDYVFSAKNTPADIFLRGRGPGIEPSELYSSDDSYIHVTAKPEACKKVSAYFINAGGLRVKIR